MKWNILIGGPAGLGPNFVSGVLAKLLVRKGFYVFCYREYESRIRGGHNFNIVSFSDKPLSSHSNDIDLLVCLDSVSVEMHKKELNDDCIILSENKNNVYQTARACRVLGISFEELDNELKNFSKYEENLVAAKEGFETVDAILRLPEVKHDKSYLLSGGEAVAVGAIASGLDFYYGYPMTPATGVMFELAARQKDYGFKVVELESEIAVSNAAIGSAMTGAKAMVGTSGGGFDLMTETLSLAGIAEIPVLFYLAQRSGPGTGAPTFQEQGDLNMALNVGHGEFMRIVCAPGDPLEAAEKTSELFYLTQKYKMPGILLSDKHLAESFYTMDEIPRMSKNLKTIKWPKRFSSYVTDDEKCSDGHSQYIKEYHDARLKKQALLARDVEKLESFKVYGNKNSKTLVVGWGSTKGAIIDAMSHGDFKFLQILYLQPFSEKIAEELKKAEKIIVIENNATSPLSELIRQKTGILIKDKILKYDGRPFTKYEIIDRLGRIK